MGDSSRRHLWEQETRLDVDTLKNIGNRCLITGGEVFREKHIFLNIGSRFHQIIITLEFDGPELKLRR